jgi:hypothetical protein
MMFISYSHADKDFVDKLAISLTSNRIPVWLDRWELKVGDSILDKLQEVLKDVRLLAVVLSKKSVESSWCRKELNAGILRELEEKHVIVLPLLLEDCGVPLFLKDKLYADFRTDYKKGLNAVLDAAEKFFNPTLGRVESDGSFNDFAVDWGIGATNNKVFLSMDVISFAPKQTHSILSQIQVTGNKKVTERYRAYEKAGLMYMYMYVLVQTCSALRDKPDLSIVIPDNKRKTVNLELRDSKSGMSVEVNVSCRRLGNDNGNTILFHLANIFGQIRDTIMSKAPKLNPSQQKKMAQLLNSL